MGESETARELSIWELLDPERPARRLRDLPGLLLRSARFVGAADRVGLAWMLGSALVVGIASGLQVLATQRVLAAVLAAGTAGGGLVAAIPAVVALVALNAVLVLASSVPRRRQELLSERVRRYAEEQVLGVATRVELDAFDDPVFYDAVQRATQSVAFGPTALVQGLAQVLQAVLEAAGLLLALAAISPVLAAVVLVGVVPVWVALQANALERFRFVRMQTPLQRRRDYLSSLLSQRQVAKEVRAYRLGTELIGRWRRLSDENLAELATSVRRRTVRELAGDLGAQLVGALALVVLVWMIATGRLTVAQAGAAGTALLALGAQLGSLGWGAGQLYEAAMFVADFEAFLAVGARVVERPPGRPVHAAFSELGVEGITFRYPGATRPALAGVDLTLRAGEVIALVGENGSGKTTLAKLLAGLYRPTSGRVTWDGVDLAELDPDGVRRRAAVVFQDFVQYAFTAYENVALGDADRLDDGDGVREAARRANADAVLEALAEGYDTQLGRMFGFGGADLSVGQWQRVALARAFFRDAPLVILDEPTAALDARAEHDLFATIRELYMDRTVVLVSHRFSTVRTADRIYVLHGGEIVEHGTHDELMAAGGRYAELFTLQASAYVASD